MRLVRDGRTFARGVPSASGGKSALRFEQRRPLAPGAYELIVRRRMEDGTTQVERVPVVIG